nr:ankyrin repeat domain-containing protein [Nitrospirota bacterium]
MWARIGLAVGVVVAVGMSAGCASELYHAAERGDLRAVQTLVGQGAVINETSGIDSELPLVGAATSGKIEVVQFLLDRGADVNMAGNWECTALCAAARSGHLPIVQLLLDRGANVNSQNRLKFAPLLIAASKGNPQVVKLLLERGADPAIPDHWGTQPLWWAVREAGNAEVVQMLLEHGADPGVKGREIDIMQDWRTPLVVAKEKGNTKIIRLLQQAEAGPVGAGAALSAAASVPAPPAAAAVPASDVDQPPAGLAKTKANAYAVVIGIDTYRNKLPKADYASHDAEVMGNYLTKVMGYEEENVAVLLNDRAAKTDIEKYIEHWLPKRVEPGASVFVYFSGHGAPNPKTGDAYLVPYDGDPAFVDATGYPLKRLYDQVGKLQAKEVVVMLDSCFSGAGGRSVLAKGMRPMVLSVENPVLAGGKTVVLAASQGDQVSSTYDQKGHGLLTYFFLKGLQGEADRNKDGSVDLAELFNYLKPQVERKARRDFNNEQTPQLLGSPELLKRGVRLVERAGP